MRLGSPWGRSKRMRDEEGKAGAGCDNGVVGDKTGSERIWETREEHKDEEVEVVKKAAKKAEK